MSLRRRHPKLLKLPTAIVRQVDEMLTSAGPERRTYEQISGWLAEQGHPTSASAIGRYGRFLAVFEQVKLAGEQAQILVKKAQSEGVLGLEEATASVATMVIMESLQEAAQRGSVVENNALSKIIEVFAKLQSSSVMRERFKGERDKGIEVAKERLLADIRREVNQDKDLCARLEQLVERRVKEMAA